MWCFSTVYSSYLIGCHCFFVSISLSSRFSSLSSLATPFLFFLWVPCIICTCLGGLVARDGKHILVSLVSSFFFFSTFLSRVPSVILDPCYFFFLPFFLLLFLFIFILTSLPVYFSPSLVSPFCHPGPPVRQHPAFCPPFVTQRLMGYPLYYSSLTLVYPPVAVK